MADPVSLGAVAVVGMVTTAAGAITKAVGAAYTGEAQARAYEYQSAVAALNAQIAKQNADYVMATSEVKAQEVGMKTRYQVGETKAIQSASGLDVNRGSAVGVRESEIEVGEQNQAIIRSNAAKQAYGYEVDAMESGLQAQMYTAAATTSRVSGNIGVAASILGGVSDVSSKWMQYKSTFG